MPRLTAPETRRHLVGVIFLVALGAFEVFNFDTTRFALQSVLGHVNFIGIGWATLLALAFCAIDFAGLTYLFSPESNNEESREMWFLLGAWLLGATMNALMTWWAVSLTFASRRIDNIVLREEQLLNIVPIFVAVVVWLTRILFIGGLSVAGTQLFVQKEVGEAKPQAIKMTQPPTPKQTTKKVPATQKSTSKRTPRSI